MGTMGIMGIMCRLRRRGRGQLSKIAGSKKQGKPIFARQQETRNQQNTIFPKKQETAVSWENHCSKFKIAASPLGAEGST
jgi:hypothetical protein